MTKSEILKYLIDSYNNGNVAITQEKVISKLFEKEYKDLISIVFPKNFTFRQKLYHYLNDDLTFKLGLCQKCGKRCKFKSFAKGYRKYCSPKCSNSSKEKIEKFKNTCLEHFGVENPAQNKKIQEKQKQTCFNNNGAYWPMQSEKCKENFKTSVYEKYDVEWPLQSKTIREKRRKTHLKNHGVEYPLQSKDIQEKTKKTHVLRYGKENPAQIEEVKEKIKNTNKERRGVEYPLQAKDVQEKTKNTNLSIYGVEYPTQSKLIKEKTKSTNLKKYDVEWTCMRPEARKYSNDSKPNKNFSKLLDEKHISYEREFPLSKYSYDFKINDFLIEINPTITHNSILDIFGNHPKKANYHLNKSNYAIEKGYFCIHVWDWDNPYDVIELFVPKQKLEQKKTVKNFTIKELNLNEKELLLELHDNKKNVQTLSFVQLASNSWKIVRFVLNDESYLKILFQHFIEKYKANHITYKCDYSKTNGIEFQRLGFVVNKKTKPEKHWYNIKTDEHIVDNGDENEQSLLDKGFLLVYDCGQLILEWTSPII